MRVRRFKRHSDKRNGIQEIDRTVLCLTAQTVSTFTLAPTLWFGCQGRISRSRIPGHASRAATLGDGLHPHGLVPYCRNRASNQRE
jgi:hypothetical protein